MGRLLEQPDDLDAARVPTGVRNGLSCPTRTGLAGVAVRETMDSVSRPEVSGEVKAWSPPMATTPRSPSKSQARSHREVHIEVEYDQEEEWPSCRAPRPRLLPSTHSTDITRHQAERSAPSSLD